MIESRNIANKVMLKSGPSMGRFLAERVPSAFRYLELVETAPDKSLSLILTSASFTNCI